MSLRQLHLLVVNAITFIRVPFILAFLGLALTHGWMTQRFTVAHTGAQPGSLMAWLALVFLTLSALTDLFDGALARKWKVVTKFGAMCDPLMDKVFYLIVFPTLLWLLPIGKPEERWHALFMVVLTILYLLRDQWVTFLRSVGSLYGADCAASFLGKFRDQIHGQGVQHALPAVGDREPIITVFFLFKVSTTPLRKVYQK